jgi:hypothetical protein
MSHDDRPDPFPAEPAPEPAGPADDKTPLDHMAVPPLTAPDDTKGG